MTWWEAFSTIFPYQGLGGLMLILNEADAVRGSPTPQATDTGVFSTGDSSSACGGSGHR